MPDQHDLPEGCGGTCKGHSPCASKVPEGVRNEFMKFWPDPGPALRAAIDKYNELLLGEDAVEAGAESLLDRESPDEITREESTEVLQVAIDSVMKGEGDAR